ncbi:MNNG and nitrosoguanidine resistance protein [Xylariomycetidae sp. FL0641]|nr:MNNG and nitrosoguanidine resistance protein [Xylariomycetidae sp. FL0641]
MGERGDRTPTPDGSNFVIAARNNSFERRPGSGSRHHSGSGHGQPHLNAPNGAGMYRRASARTIRPSTADDLDVVDPYDYDYAREKGRMIARLQPHRSVGFWHPQLRKVRKHVLLLWARTILIIMVFVMAVLSMYWAVLYNVEENMRTLVVHVVDFDGSVAPYDPASGGPAPLVGPTVTQLTEQAFRDHSHPSLGYQTVPAVDYDFDPANVRRAVYHWTAWAAIVVNPNATAALTAAAQAGDADYDPAGAVQYIVQSARQDSTYYNYINPQFETLSRQFAAEFGRQWTQRLLNNDTFDRGTLAQAPAVVNPGVEPLTIDLRPFSPPTATPAVSIGLIYLIIIAFFSFAFFLPIHMKYIVPVGHPPLHFWQFIVWRWVATVTSYIFVSLAYSLVSLAFQIPFWPPPGSEVEPVTNATAYGRGTFAVYWMLNFVGMCALGIACENMAMLLGQPWTAFWLIFWVITNVSTAFYTVEVAPGFFRWGYAWPLHHIVQASRQIVFDLHSNIGTNFGVLFAWAGLGTILFPFCCYFMRWKTEREQRDQERQKDRYVVKTEDGDREFLKRAGERPPVRKRGFMRGV